MNNDKFITYEDYSHAVLLWEKSSKFQPLGVHLCHYYMIVDVSLMDMTDNERTKSYFQEFYVIGS